VLVVGYCNAYVHYVTTPEEYLAQRYEGGSTIFGRWELPALQQVVAGLAESMRDHYPMDLGMPPALRPQRSWVPKARVDTAPGGFGAVTRQPRDGNPGDRIRVEFESAYPNNDLRRGSTYLEVQREVEPGRWVRVADDGDWSTLFRWKRVGRSRSRVTISWDVPADAVPGTYRIVHHMDVRHAGGAVTAASGISRGFAISPDRPGAR
jgi:neutral ceramidase